jgi:protocatechuate 3,4-dioxygenase beta subunit
MTNHALTAPLDDVSIGRILTRRELLARLGAAAVVLTASSKLSWALYAAAGFAPVASCVATPEQTEGPYFVDEHLNRSDIRSDPSDGSVRPGLPLDLALRVARVSNGGCAPLPGATVDIWHCDALGQYSDFQEEKSAGKKFLRGYQTTDASGAVRFTTIYPGWYQGRAVHIHFKIRSTAEGGKVHDFTSQLYFDEAVTDRVHSQPPYGARGLNRTKNVQDSIYRDHGSQLIPQLTRTASGYTAAFDVGLLIA